MAPGQLLFRFMVRQAEGFPEMAWAATLEQRAKQEGNLELLREVRAWRKWHDSPQGAYWRRMVADNRRRRSQRS